MSGLKTDAENALADVKAKITELEAVAHSDEVKVKNVWTRYEVYLCLAGGLIAGFIVGHWVF